MAWPGRQTIALCGDGGFTMLGLGDLITQVQLGAPVVNVIFDNQQLDFVWIEQQEAGYKPFGTDMPNPDLAKVAEALGARALRVTKASEVRPAVEQALAHHGGPVVLDVMVDPAALAMPSHLPAKLAQGFTLSSMKRAFSSGAPELAAEVRDNLSVL
jgi:pyruvate dehydrogenase (quinone)